MLYIGTSGFSYDDWQGAYYPQDLPKRERLRFYAQEFAACELNFTYYRLPNAKTLAAMVDKTPQGFLFTAKATQDLTHSRDAEPAMFAQFAQGLRPLLESGRFGCVLAQFPFSFRPSAENRQYLARFRERLGGLPVVVEFRNAHWLVPETFAFLEQSQLGFCCVDEPRLPELIPPIARVTSDVAYVRFHGRNAAKWWRHEEAWQRYDYRYSREELLEWVPRIQELSERASNTFVFANNHWQGQAIDTARQLRLLLENRVDERGSGE